MRSGSLGQSNKVQNAVRSADEQTLSNQAGGRTERLTEGDLAQRFSRLGGQAANDTRTEDDDQIAILHEGCTSQLLAR